MRTWRHRCNVKRLVAEGVLVPVRSFEEYADLVKKARADAKHRLFSNCYMMPDEIQRLIQLGLFYRIASADCLAFADDEDDYYYVFLFVDLEAPFHLPQLDRNMLVENVYYDKRKTPVQEQFEAAVQKSGFQYVHTYLSVVAKPQLSPEVFWQRMKAIQKSLAAENKKIAVVQENQIKAFKKIYKEEIDVYTRKRYSNREWREHAKNNLLYCVTDTKGEVYAIWMSGVLRGGAIAARHDCHGNIYAMALMFYTNVEFYSHIPSDPKERALYMKNRAIGGWIATDNNASWRLHKGIGKVASGKAMTQFVKPGFGEQ